MTIIGASAKLIIDIEIPAIETTKHDARRDAIQYVKRHCSDADWNYYGIVVTSPRHCSVAFVCYYPPASGPPGG